MARGSAVIMVLLLLVAWQAAAAEPPVLTVVSWGGAYETAQREAIFAPFTAKTGIEIRVARYDGGLAELRRQQEKNKTRWDVVDMTMSDTRAACTEGLLQSLDAASLLAPAPDGTPGIQDLIPGAITRCGITHSVYATVIAYDRRAFPGLRPRSVADLFDTQRFPGRRALQRGAAGNLEWALLSYAVPTAEVYSLLSTKRGLQLAWQQLETIADETLWWEHGDAPARWLAAGCVAMASGYNGRFFHAIATQNAPIEIVWDGQIQEYDNWAIPQDAPNPQAARKFIRFATTAKTLAAFASRVPYGPSRDSALQRITTHPTSGLDMSPHLPTHPFNARRAVIKDTVWYAQTYDRIHQRFGDWSARYDDQATPCETLDEKGESSQSEKP